MKAFEKFIERCWHTIVVVWTICIVLLLVLAVIDAAFVSLPWMHP